MSTLLLWRLMKFVGLIVLARGTLGLRLSPWRSERLDLVYRWFVPGMVLTWTGGWMLMKHAGRSPAEPWILIAILASLASMHAAFLVSHREEPMGLGHGLASGGLFAAVAVMTVRNGSLGIQIAAAVAGFGLGMWLLKGAGREALSLTAEDEAKALGAFVWLARLEGLTLLILVGLLVPLRVAAGIELDGGTGVIGWVHGVLFFVYIQAVASVGRMKGWSMMTRGIAVAAGLLPFGTFVFERKFARE